MKHKPKSSKIEFFQPVAKLGCSFSSLRRHKHGDGACITSF